MEEKRFCSECGTESEAKFEFCKNCGKELYSENRESEYKAAPSHYDVYNDCAIISEIDGIPTEDVAAFIGSKADKILRKLTKMQLTASKVGWCWPVAILSYLFGPVGAAFWYLYRKMYKAAAIFMAIGIILSAATTAISIYTADSEGQSGSVEEIIGAYTDYISGDITDEEYFEIMSDYASLGASGYISNLSGVICLVVTGLFSYHWYKNHIIKSIMRVKALNTDPRYYHYALTASGGTSGGAVLVGIIIYIVAFAALSSVSALYSVI